MKILLEIEGARGYGSEQVKSITVGQLKEMLEGYDDNTEIVTHDETNRYGASYGIIRYVTEDEYYDEDEEEE